MNRKCKKTRGEYRSSIVGHSNSLSGYAIDKNAKEDEKSVTTSKQSGRQQPTPIGKRASKGNSVKRTISTNPSGEQRKSYGLMGT